MADGSPTTLSEVLRAYLDAFGAGLRVSLPGRIERYDATKRCADVRPLLKSARINSDGVRVVESLPLCLNVPVLFVGGGGGALTFPVVKGDFCELRFADESLDRWKSKGGEVDPGEVRPHDLSNAIALVGLQDFSRVVAADAEDVALVGPDGAGGIWLQPNGEVHLGAKAASELVAWASKVATELNTIKARFLALETAMTAVPALEPGMGAPSVFQLQVIAAIAANPYPTPGSVAAAKTKAL